MSKKVENKVEEIKKVSLRSKKVEKYITIEDSDIVILNLNHIDNFEKAKEFKTFVLDTIKNSADKKGDVEFDEYALLNTIFPLVTNIDMSDLTKEEVEEIIASPSEDLVKAKNIINDMIYNVFEEFVTFAKSNQKVNKIVGK